MTTTAGHILARRYDLGGCRLQTKRAMSSSERHFKQPRQIETKPVSHHSVGTARKRAAESDQGIEQRIAYGVEFDACSRKSHTTSPLHQGKSQAKSQARAHS